MKPEDLGRGLPDGATGQAQCGPRAQLLVLRQLHEHRLLCNPAALPSHSVAGRGREGGFTGEGDEVAAVLAGGEAADEDALGPVLRQVYRIAATG